MPAQPKEGLSPLRVAHNIFLFTAANQKSTPYANREEKRWWNESACETAQETLSLHWFFEGQTTLKQRRSLPHIFRRDVPFFVAVRVIFFTTAPALPEKPNFHSTVGPEDSGESESEKISALAYLSPSQLRCFQNFSIFWKISKFLRAELHRRCVRWWTRFRSFVNTSKYSSIGWYIAHGVSSAIPFQSAR